MTNIVSIYVATILRYRPVVLAVGLAVLVGATPVRSQESSTPVPKVDSMSSAPADTLSAATPTDSLTLIASSSPYSLSDTEIGSTGAVRLSELFRMIPGMVTWSSDRYTLRMLGTGMGGLHTGGPAIRMDGLDLPMRLLDRERTEALPLSPVDVQSVSFSPHALTVRGGRVRDGTLDVRTPMLSGWDARGSIAVINETGDPGPAKHLDGRLNNVDRSGPATALRLGWGNGRWMIQAGLQSDLHHLTDERISGRVRRTYAEVRQPVITQFSPFVRLRRESSSSRMQVVGGRSWRKDFLFHESAGWEWPVRWKQDWMAGSSETVWGGLLLGMHVDASKTSSTNRPSFIALPAPLSLYEASIESRIGLKKSSWDLFAHAGARGLRVEQASSTSALWPKAGFSLSWVQPRFRQRKESSGMFGSVSISALKLDDTFPQSRPWSLAAESRIGKSDPVGLAWSWTTGFSSGHFPEAGDLAMWSAAGVDLGEWMTLDRLQSKLSPPRTLQTSLTIEYPLSSEWTGWASLETRFLSNFLLESRRIEQPFGMGPMVVDWHWSTPHDGWLFARSFGAYRLKPDRVQWRVLVRFQHVSSEGDDGFFRSVTGYPRNHVHVIAGERRDGGFRWFVRGQWLSGWTWPE